MYPLNTIQKQNGLKQVDHENAREGTFCVLQDGSILIRNRNAARTIEDKKAAKAFLESVRGKSTGAIKEIVLSHFTP